MSEKTIGLIGAGTMGCGIAQLAAQNGYGVIVRDVDEEILEDGLTSIKERLDSAAAHGFVDDPEAVFDRIVGTTEIEPVTSGPELIIEAVNENLDLKQSIFAELDERTDPSVILGSNTSSISITEIATATAHPGRVVGTHFFNPPVKMKLIEVVSGYETNDGAIDRVEQFASTVGHESIVVEDYPGFATSRLGVVLGMEAARMVQEGVASAEDIDKAMEIGYNLPVGPLELGDRNGWDVRAEIGEYLAEELGRDVYRPPQNVKQMVRAGKVGVKSGRGFYEWDDSE